MYCKKLDEKKWQCVDAKGYDSQQTAHVKSMQKLHNFSCLGWKCSIIDHVLREPVFVFILSQLLSHSSETIRPNDKDLGEGHISDKFFKS